jgi:hypothetical protein
MFQYPQWELASDHGCNTQGLFDIIRQPVDTG